MTWRQWMAAVSRSWMKLPMKLFRSRKEVSSNMAFSLTWLPDVLKGPGLKISLVPGWQTRGLGDVGQIVGVMCHHTGVNNPKRLNIPSLHSLRDGRKAEPNLSALPGPLAQLGLARDGTYFVIAAGKAIHAGPGVFKDFTGNSRFIGIEAENH